MPSEADRFIRLHPNHPNVGLRLLLKSIVRLSVSRSFAGPTVLFGSGEPGATWLLRESYSELATLLNEFPDSQYAADARQRMLQLRELLARAEIFAADYYLRRGAFLSPRRIEAPSSLKTTPTPKPARMRWQ